MRLQQEIASHAASNAIPAESFRSQSLTTRYYDFWMLGGASIFLGVAMLLASFLRGRSVAIDESFSQVFSCFLLLSVICNHPHFVLSYRFAYGRGWKFVRDHAFSLIVVPVALIGLFVASYFNFDRDVSASAGVAFLNRFYDSTGWGFQFGTLSTLGSELLGFSVWLMFLTVGWHYAKQTFGCVLVYSRYDDYSISKLQRRLLKWSVFSVAFFNFIYFTVVGWNEGTPGHLYYSNTPVTPMFLPKAVLWVAGASVIASGLAVLYFIGLANHRQKKKLASLNTVIPWVAFHCWWIPVMRVPEFYLMTVPFFHSLQYLPFAYRMERPKAPHGSMKDFKLSVRIAALLLIGYLAFSFVPHALDAVLKTEWAQTQFFFVIAFVVFINVHHFFIDSVVWKFENAEVRASLFDGPVSQGSAGSGSAL
jgi:hypothetical protein